MNPLLTGLHTGNSARSVERVFFISWRWKVESITTLNALLDWVVRVGAMLLAFGITERVQWPVGAEARRYFSFLVAAVIGLAAWYIGIEFGYIEKPPADWHAWVESGAAMVLTIVLGSQVAHARAVLSKRG